MSEPVPFATLTAFEGIRYRADDGHEFWLARELMTLLGYKTWHNFETVIDEAIAVCEREGPDAVAGNFTAISKNSPGESNRGRKGTNYHLTRHACYLIAQSADGRKAEVALAKIYFAIAVEQMEMLSQLEEELLRLESRPELLAQNRQLAVLARQAGVITDVEFATFWNAGYLGLYHETAHQIRSRKGIGPRKDIGDYASSDELAANIFKASLARQLMQTRGAASKIDAYAAHFEAGERVRRTLDDAQLPTPELLATPTKSYQHLVKEQKMRLRLKLEDVIGLWAQLQEGQDQGI